MQFYPLCTLCTQRTHRAHSGEHGSPGRHWLTRARRALAALLLVGPAAAAVLELDEYVQRANAAKSRADWESAASQFAQAVNHPDLPKAGALRSAMHLEYGRALGVLCHYDEAEKYLLLAHEIAVKAKGPAFQVLYELGAISVAQKKYTGAVGYFSAMEREPGDKVSPLVLVDAQEKFATALTAAGKPDEAELRRREAERLRSTGAKPAPPGTITPYGAQCPKS